MFKVSVQLKLPVEGNDQVVPDNVLAHRARNCDTGRLALLRKVVADDGKCGSAHLTTFAIVESKASGDLMRRQGDLAAADSNFSCAPCAARSLVRLRKWEARLPENTAMGTSRRNSLRELSS